MPPLRFGRDEGGEPAPGPIRWPRLRKERSLRRQLAETVLIMAITIGAAFLVRPARGEVSGALIFVLGIIWVGSTLGLAQALLASSLSFLLYNFYFAEPILTFRVDTLSDLTPLIVFNASAVIAGILSGRLRDQAEAAASANDRLSALLSISGSLQSALTFDDIRRALEAEAGKAAGICQLAVTQTGSGSRDDRARLARSVPGSVEENLVHIECAGQAWHFAIAPRPGGRQSGNAAMTAALANLVSLALERARLSEKIAEAEAFARTEGLKTSLLSSVSHDFRTPLATISASASSLLEFGDRLDGETATRFLHTILDESERLNRFTANLLEMTKLEAGQTPPGQLISVSDVVGSAVRRVRPRVGSRRIERTEGADCIVLADPTLFELAIGNVLENALLYSEDGTRICIRLSCAERRCIIEIADEGLGIPPNELDRVFARFYRLDRTQQAGRGTGLGLAIARGFVAAFGGTIAARVPGVENRGTTIRIELPLAALEPE